MLNNINYIFLCAFLGENGFKLKKIDIKDSRRTFRKVWNKVYQGR